MLKLFKVSGNSLYPFYKDGQRILCLKIFKFNPIKKDDTVVFSKDNYGLMVKKVISIENGHLKNLISLRIKGSALFG